MKPHIHENEIIAWAKGYQIQSYSLHLDGSLKWVDDPNPSWDQYVKYRVKPNIADKIIEEFAWQLKEEFGYVVPAAAEILRKVLNQYNITPKE